MPAAGSASLREAGSTDIVEVTPVHRAQNFLEQGAPVRGTARAPVYSLPFEEDPPCPPVRSIVATS